MLDVTSSIEVHIRSQPVVGRNALQSRGKNIDNIKNGVVVWNAGAISTRQMQTPREHLYAAEGDSAALMWRPECSIALVMKKKGSILCQ